MMKGFKEFLLKNNVLALAIAVVMGGAVGKMVSSLVSDILMPVLSPILGGGEWRSAKIILSKTVGADGKEVINSINYGSFVGGVVDFVIIAFVIYMITKSLLKEPPPAPPAPTKTCPKCLETVAPGASKCKYCTADI
jgi:large conductance mechanosensitive channel